jgi:ATP-dependent helicase/DNAse subunit B
LPHGLAARAFSATALQRYAACPYQFYLQAVQRLAPPDVAEAIEEIDPLARGSLVHEVLYLAHTAFTAAGLLPLSPARHEAARALLDRLLDEVAARWRDDLAPAVPRVWEDGVAAVRADLGEWLRRACAETTWQPWRFELAFGLREPEGDRGRDAASRAEPVPLECGITLRGAIDLVERRADGALRATDFKTGRNRGKRWQVIAGGATLQPVLYPLALEKLQPEAQVVSGRLYFCTHAGGYAEVEVPLDAHARRAAGAVARTVGEALATAFFPAAPAPGACDTCDYTDVCGPGPASRERHAKPEHTPLVRLRLER